MTRVGFFLSMVFVLLVGCVSTTEVRQVVNLPSANQHAFITVKTGEKEIEYSKKDISKHGGIPLPKYNKLTILLQGYVNLHPQDVILSAACRLPAFGFVNNNFKYTYDPQTSLLKLWLDFDDVFTVTCKPLTMKFKLVYLQYNKLVTLTNIQDVFLTDSYSWEFTYFPVFDVHNVSSPPDYSLNVYHLPRNEFLSLYKQVEELKRSREGLQKLKKMSAKIIPHFLSRVEDSELSSYLKTFKLLASSERQ